MRLLRPPDRYAFALGNPVPERFAALVVLGILIHPSAASAGLDLSASAAGWSTSWPSAWVAEALTVALAFALPAIIAGVSVVIRRAFTSKGRSDAIGYRLR